MAPLLPEALSVPVVRTGLAGGGGKLDEAPAPAPAPPWPPEKPGEVAARLVVVVVVVSGCVERQGNTTAYLLQYPQRR